MGLNIKHLSVTVDHKEIIKDLDLTLSNGHICCLMGPNGSGKSTLARALMAAPGLKVSGQMAFGRQNLLKLKPEERSRAGVFLAFQYPVEVPGVNVMSYLFELNRQKNPSESLDQFKNKLDHLLVEFNLSAKFLERHLNENFSGGEKKKFEALQLVILKPKLIILDEIDAGLDVDALKTVCQLIMKYRRPESILLVITHYQRVLKFIKPDTVYVMIDGQIVEKGDIGLVKRVEKDGYNQFKVKS